MRPDYGVWWVLYYDQTGKRYQERVGPKSLAMEVYRQLKPDITGRRVARYLVKDLLSFDRLRHDPSKCRVASGSCNRGGANHGRAGLPAEFPP